MSLKEILQKLAAAGDPILLCDSRKEWKAAELLQDLSEPMLKRRAHFQPGLYIALINEGGYLGEVLYKVKAA